MDLRLVKTAPGRRLRHPATHQVLVNVADADAAPHKVDLADPHWYRALERGDIVEVMPSPAPSATATSGGATAAPAALASPSATVAPKAAAAPGTSVEA